MKCFCYVISQKFVYNATKNKPRFCVQLSVVLRIVEVTISDKLVVVVFLFIPDIHCSRNPAYLHMRLLQ